MIFTSFRNLILALISISFVALSGCNSSKSSEPAQALGSASNPFSGGDITFNVMASANPTVLLNSRNITEQVEFSGTQGSFNFNEVDFALAQGDNRLQINQQGSLPSTQNFFFDDQGPEVVIKSAIPNGLTVDVIGTVNDPSGVAALRINQQNISVDDNGDFTVNIPQSDDYLVFAQDSTNGFSSADKYLPAGTTSDPMIRASIDETLIQSFSPLIAQAIVADKPPELFDGINPLFNVDLGFVTLDLNLTAFETQQDVSGNPIGTSTIGLSIPQQGTGTIAAAINIQKPIIGLSIDVFPSDNSASFTVAMNVKADSIDVSAINIALNTNEQEEFSISFVDQLPLNLTNTSLEIVDNASGTVVNNVIIDLLTSFVIDSIEGILADALPGILNEQITTLIPPAFLGVNIDDDNALFKIGLNNFSTDGTKLIADLTSQYKTKLVLNNDYALGIKTAVNINKNTGVIGQDEPLALPNERGQINASISFDFINQALLFAYESGLFNFNIIDSVVVLGEPTSTVVADDSMRIQIEPSIPELEIINADSQVNASINLKDFNLSVSTGQNNAWSKLVELNLNIEILAGFGFDEVNKELFLTPTKTAPKIRVENITFLNFIPLPSFLINGIIDLFSPALGDVLGSIRLPVPVPEELPVQIKDISTVGANNNQLSLSLDVDIDALLESLEQGTGTVVE